MPKKVTVDGKILNRTDELKANEWTWEKLKDGGVLKINHSKGKAIKISK